MNKVIKMFGNLVHTTSQRRKNRQAINELRSLSDRELNDLGLSRGSIVSAVINGRPGYDRHAA